jgi:hypothetical protein
MNYESISLIEAKRGHHWKVEQHKTFEKRQNEVVFDPSMNELWAT